LLLCHDSVLSAASLPIRSIVSHSAAVINRSLITDSTAVASVPRGRPCIASLNLQSVAIGSLSAAIGNLSQLPRTVNAALSTLLAAFSHQKCSQRTKSAARWLPRRSLSILSVANCPYSEARQLLV